MNRAVARRCLSELALPAPTTDAELLARSADGTDPDAFAALVRRHGPIVLATCRRVLGPSPDTEDAFQMTFLALARRVGSIRRPGALAAWIHRTALRIALRTKRRRAPVVPLSADPIDPSDPLAGVAWRDLRQVLDEELDRLPDEYRGPLVLCLLDGCTRDEAAERLGYSLNTLKRRLDAGRALLRARLLRRGVAPVALAVCALEPGGLRAAVPPELVAAVAQSVATARAPALALGALVGRWRIAVLGVVGVALAVALGSGAIPAPAPDADGADQRAGARTAPPTAPERPTAADGADPLPAGAVARFGTLRYRVPDRILSTALSPDGKFLAVAGGNPVRVYEAATWKLVHELPLEPGEWFRPLGPDLAFSPDGRYLGHVVNGRHAYVWDLRTGKRAHRFDGTSLTRWERNFCAFSPDGLFALSDKDRLYFHDPTTGREIRSVPAGRVGHLSSDGKFYVRYPEATRDTSAEPILGEPKTGKDLPGTSEDTRWGAGSDGVAFAPDGKTLAVNVASGWGVELWSVEPIKKLATFRNPLQVFRRDKGGRDVGFTADGLTVFLCISTGDILRWDARTHKELPRLKAGAGSPLTGLHALPDGKTLLTPCPDGWVRVWDAETGKEIPVPGRYRNSITTAQSPDGKAVAVGDETGRLDLCDARTGALLRTVRASGPPVWKLEFGPDGNLLAVGERVEVKGAVGTARRVRVLRTADGETVRTLGEDGPKTSYWYAMPVGFSADGGRVFISTSGAVTSWDLKTGERGVRIPANGGALSPDRKVLATSENGDAVLVDAATGKVLKRVEVDPPAKKRPGLVESYPFGWSADGRTLACAVPGARVVVLDPETGRERRRFEGYPGPAPLLPHHPELRTREIIGVHVSPDGKWIVTTGINTHVAGVWEVATGRSVVTVATGYDSASARFTPDGRGLLVFGSGVGHRWDLTALLAPDPKLTPAELWEAAAGADAGAAARAAVGLVTTESGQRLLRDKLPPVRADVTEARIKQWVADLGSADFATREGGKGTGDPLAALRAGVARGYPDDRERRDARPTGARSGTAGGWTDARRTPGDAGGPRGRDRGHTDGPGVTAGVGEGC